MRPTRLNIVSSIGDPRHPVTWSGTPAAICNALEKAGVALKVVNITPSLRLTAAARLVARLARYGTVDVNRVGFGHAVLAYRARTATRAIGPGDFLHFGSDHLPLAGRSYGQRHYLFTDYALHILCNNSDYQARTNPRMRTRLLELEAAMVAGIDGIFTTADYVATSFQNRYMLLPGKVLAVKSGLGRILPDPGQKDYADGYMLFVARQNFINKGGPLLLDAFDIVRAQKTDSRLFIIGNTKDPWQAPYLERMQNTPGITFHNFDTPQYRNLVANAALYAGPAPDEPWGIIYLESLSVRTPVAGLARNAFPQFAGGGRYGFAAKADDPRSVADMLLDALSDPARLTAMGAAGREHVIAEYDWDRVAERILNHLEAA